MGQKHKLPPIGLRIVKSAVAVFLCLTIGQLRGEESTLFYMVLAALWCIQSDMASSWSMGLQRVIGTLIGAVYGLAILLIELYIWPIHEQFLGYLVDSLMIIPVIYTTVLINRPKAAFYSCVVFLSITVTHITDASPFLFVWNRTLDTVLGLAIGLAVNACHIPLHYQKDTLFVASLDEMLLTMDETLTPYSKVELNRILDSGAKFTISSARTPASLCAPLRNINLKLPVIAMDGAVLYDVNQRAYLHSYVMSPAMTRDISRFLADRGFHFFTNVVIEDTLIIYYQELDNPVAEQVYESMRHTSMRNYVHLPVPEDASAVYLLILDTKEKIDGLWRELDAAGYTDRLKITLTTSNHFPEYTYMRIFSRNATVANMTAYLQEYAGAHSVVTLGSSPESTVVLPESEPNLAVRKLLQMYEPYFWEK